MLRTITIAFLVARAFGTKCDAGYKHKANLIGLHCSTSVTDAAGCSSTCCKKDEKKCGGLSVTCPSDKYHADTDAWKNTVATEKTKLTACCTEKAICGSASYTCPAGKKKLFAVFTTYAEKAWHAKPCPGGPDSCSAACCTADDTTKCGGHANTKVGSMAAAFCAKDDTTVTPATDPQYKIATPDDAWKKMKISPATAAGQKSTCCGVRATCGSKLYSCPAGKKRVTANALTLCTGDASKCAGTTGCCTADTNTCGGSAVTGCTGNQYNPATVLTGDAQDSWKNRATTPATKDTDCCTTRATCADAVCPGGYKKKAKVDKFSCANNRDSCMGLVGGECCELDLTECGGVGGIACPYGYYDESTTWIAGNADLSKNTPQATMDAWKEKPTTSATKNKDCCTAKAVCEYEAPGTTTPSPVAATTTPAAPVRRYSEHMLAVKKGEDVPRSSNMVWLAVGGFIGMGVLMAVQGLRSRMQRHSAALE